MDNQTGQVAPMEPGRIHNLMARRTLTISVPVDTLAMWACYGLGLALVFCGYVLIGYAGGRSQE